MRSSIVRLTWRLRIYSKLLSDKVDFVTVVCDTDCRQRLPRRSIWGLDTFTSTNLILGPRDLGIVIGENDAWCGRQHLHTAVLECGHTGSDSPKRRSHEMLGVEMEF